jgi:hypothetical protein
MIPVYIIDLKKAVLQEYKILLFTKVLDEISYSGLDILFQNGTEKIFNKDLIQK